MAISATAQMKGVGDPNTSYESMSQTWLKIRAICSGEAFTKAYDDTIDIRSFSNLLIPFSPSMTDAQYQFYKAEAELPGIVSQYAKFIVGGLLRKVPQVTLPDTVEKEVADWLINEIGRDNSPLVSFLNEALWEELQTSRCWILVDYPVIKESDNMTTEDFLKYKPYPTIIKAESIINWRTEISEETGQTVLNRVIIRTLEEKFDDNDPECFHPKMMPTVWVHQVVNNVYSIKKYQETKEAKEVIVQGHKIQDTNKSKFELVEEIPSVLFQGEPLSFIPMWPLNGSIEVSQPVLINLVDKEVALYNKTSRRNHLLYGAATYTPYIASNMTDEEFDEAVSKGLGSWLRLYQGDAAGVLDTPTNALADMDRAIEASIEEMARLGVRMLTPEVAQSGVALDIRNASQTAQLGSLNTKISNTLSSIFAFMVNWRFGSDLKGYDVKFNMCDDFNASPLGVDWVRLVTEWYESGLIPRSTWLRLAKQNDIIDPAYNDEEGKQEIAEDDFIINKQEQTLLNNELMVGQYNQSAQYSQDSQVTTDQPPVEKAKQKKDN